MGRFRSVLQNWLFRAVNSNGAVSPEMRAMASNIPVTSPLRAAGYTTFVIVRQGCAPSAAEPSRMPFGTSRSMSSVVRTITGSEMMPSEIAPAIAEK